jgi:MSHA biogenesis protein MshJ
MKLDWQPYMARVDAFSLRERAIIFVMAVSIVMLVVNAVLLDPLYAKYKLLSEQVKQDQTKTTEIRQEIQKKLSEQAVDPDEIGHRKLTQLNEQSAQMQNALLAMQKGLVSPEKMAALLEDILKRNGQLRLLSLKTLPVTSLNESLPSYGKANPPKAAGAPAGTATSEKAEEQAGIAVYKHGVEIVVQGSYLDMMNYMVALEAMPWQVFWGKAKLSTDEYPKATLALTLYTLSLDKKWLKL